MKQKNLCEIDFMEREERGIWVDPDTIDDFLVLATQKQLTLDLEIESQRWGAEFEKPLVDVQDYDLIIVCLSGGKDSIACLLFLLLLGANPKRIELWHHEVDGREGSTLMDWPFIPDYCRKIAQTFDIPIYFSWLVGGFEGELLKDNEYSQPHCIETPDGLLILERDKERSKPNTRKRFPQISANLNVRWCSSELKIAIGRRSLTNQERFNGKKILFVTGERRQESANRAKYYQFEPHTCDARKGKKQRHVDTWRPVLGWDESQIWKILQRFGVNPPVPYRLGWNRSSCMKCIFNNPTIWATLYHYFPGSLAQITNYEKQFNCTINPNKLNVTEIAQQAKPLTITDQEALYQATQTEYSLPIIVAPESWQLPPGAFKNLNCGPI